MDSTEDKKNRLRQFIADEIEKARTANANASTTHSKTEKELAEALKRARERAERAEQAAVEAERAAKKAIDEENRAKKRVERISKRQKDKASKAQDKAIKAATDKRAVAEAKSAEAEAKANEEKKHVAEVTAEAEKKAHDSIKRARNAVTRSANGLKRVQKRADKARDEATKADTELQNLKAASKSGQQVNADVFKAVEQRVAITKAAKEYAEDRESAARDRHNAVIDRSAAKEDAATSRKDKAIKAATARLEKAENDAKGKKDKARNTANVSTQAIAYAKGEYLEKIKGIEEREALAKERAANATKSAHDKAESARANASAEWAKSYDARMALEEVTNPQPSTPPPPSEPSSPPPSPPPPSEPSTTSPSEDTSSQERVIEEEVSAHERVNNENIEQLRKLYTDYIDALSLLLKNEHISPEDAGSIYRGEKDSEIAELGLGSRDFQQRIGAISKQLQAQADNGKGGIKVGEKSLKEVSSISNALSRFLSSGGSASGILGLIGAIPGAGPIAAIAGVGSAAFMAQNSTFNDHAKAIADMADKLRDAAEQNVDRFVIAKDEVVGAKYGIDDKKVGSWYARMTAAQDAYWNGDRSISKALSRVGFNGTKAFAKGANSADFLSEVSKYMNDSRISDSMKRSFARTLFGSASGADMQFLRKRNDEIKTVDIDDVMHKVGGGQNTIIRDQSIKTIEAEFDARNKKVDRTTPFFLSNWTVKFFNWVDSQVDKWNIKDIDALQRRGVSAHDAANMSQEMREKLLKQMPILKAFDENISVIEPPAPPIDSVKAQTSGTVDKSQNVNVNVENNYEIHGKDAKETADAVRASQSSTTTEVAGKLASAIRGNDASRRD